MTFPGGFFAGKLSSVTDKAELGTRFDDSSDSKIAAMYRKRYINNGYIGALDILKAAAVRPFCSTPRQRRTCARRALTYSIQAKNNLRLTEIALRWVQHHSVLGPGDGIILGASSAAQLEQNIDDRCIFNLYLTLYTIGCIAVESSMADASFFFSLFLRLRFETLLAHLLSLLLPLLRRRFSGLMCSLASRMIDDTSEKGPLPQEALDAVDAAWAKVGMGCPPYWR